MIEIIESYGKCKECGIEGILGDDLCISCWDGPDLNRDEIKRRNKKIIKLLKQGMGDYQVASKFKIGHATVRKIRLGYLGVGNAKA